MNLQTAYQNLKNSPMFHFSLHAKELFHSNFLAWLNSDAELKPLFKEVMKGFGVDGEFIESWGNDFEVVREKHNIDLIVKAPDSKRGAKTSNANCQPVDGNWYVMMENKVKSIPNAQQLKDYADKYPNVREKLLLSIVEVPQELNDGWKGVNYTQLVDALKKGIEKIADPYKKAIIFDYIAMIEALISIVASQEVTENSKFNFEPSQELNELRIADLVDKWRASTIANYASNRGLTINSGYTTSSLIETYEEIDNVMFGVQIQGRQYRRVMIDNIHENEIAKKSNGFLCEMRKEFRDNMLKLYPGVFEARAIAGEDKKNFCSYKNKKDAYGRRFWYQYVSISDDTSVKQIVNCIINDVKLIKQLSSK